MQTDVDHDVKLRDANIAVLTAAERLLREADKLRQRYDRLMKLVRDEPRSEKGASDGN